ncbi:hypothetical protein IW140_004657 [Coemansia sp. RSA 1813]|nr:hypothetical protein EV178_004708 [Coemansia sp. RSA 1646]KAJ1767631.1 hypothetical protein LPJ74_005266 [Coemansia sp. RSA 1843]KAJ2087621.1 hypothetical protein IW138_004824 [Coemansia sp. RSA 986]KAJ2214366.1 hypothetical protein EV179_003031 [Coemansia sp. RSA 487]KAJ2567090.1 hypothetical protein IW140_004657 [Coemansia sp. RSA 1813]
MSMESREQYTNTLSYVATCASMLCGGTTSLFATYGSSFGEVLGFTQYETNLVASLGDYAHYMSAPLFGYLSARIGPTRVVQTAGILMFFGYMGLSYAFKYFDTPNEHAHHYVATMSMLFAFVGVGSKAAYMSSMATTAKNFKQSRYSGIALGIPLSLYGLSTFVFSSVKAGWFESDSTPSRYLAVMAIVSGVAHIAASRFVRLREDPRNAAAMAAAERRRASLSIVTASKESGAVADVNGGTGSSLSESIEMKETRRRRTTVSSPNMGAGSPREDGDVATGNIPISPLDSIDSLANKSAKDITISSVLTPGTKIPQHGPSGGTSPTVGLAHEQSIIHRFRKDPVAWAMLLGLICFSGPGLAFVNNCGSMVRAMSHKTSLTPEQVGKYKDKIVATQSFFSFSSRLAIGYFSDIWRTRLRLPRSGLLVLAALLMIYAQHYAAHINRLEDLYPLAVLIGIAMGSVFTLAPTITSETWGADNFGVCWGVITLGPAIGGHICNLIFGSSWDEGQLHIATRMGPETPQDQLQCDNECFIPAFLTTIKIAYLGVFFFALVLCLPRASSIWWRRAD